MHFPGIEVKRERAELDVSLEVLSDISGVSVSALSQWERDIKQPSYPAIRAVQAALASLQAVRRQYEGIPLNMNAIAWLRQQIAAMNDGADARAIAAAGESAPAAA